MLDAVPRYDADRVSATGDRAVVVGASMAGLLAARVLADACEEVLVLERDDLPDEPVSRRGVPQASHPHVLQEAGRATLEDLVPGYGEDLLSAGGLLVDVATDLQFYVEGDYLADAETRLPMYCASRPLFEAVARRRIGAREDVTLRGNCQCLDYDLDAETGTVTGVVVRDGDETATISADLVVDATGRTSRTPAWLEEHGFPTPPVDEVGVDVAYSTTRLERPADDRRSVAMLPEHPRRRGAVLFPIEGEQWLLTLLGVHGDHPPRTFADFADFAATLPAPEFEAVLDAHAPVDGAVVHYPFPTEIRRRYETLDRFPDGLLVLGDAVASFNPFYGQGMSVAALEAVVLHHVLATGRRDGLAVPFFERAADLVDVAWTFAVGADVEFPQTTGPAPRGVDLANWYLSRLCRLAHADADLAEAYARVISMERRPRSLLRPGVLWRVLGP